MKEDLLKIINHYGLMESLKYIHSEYFELDEAIMDYRCLKVYNGISSGKYHKDHIAEEIADVMNMLKQFQYYYNIKDKQIEDIMKTKVKRELKRISLESKGE